ncbi:MAG: 6-phosphogluconolactonase, partial [Microlunatus sp.]|nr:6-phosphogluconolactonase [Microlunatus sp.]
MTQEDLEILVHPTADEVAEAVAARLLARLVEIQREARLPQVALTGGRIATAAYEQLGELGRSAAVDWSRVSLWWGDERFVSADDGDRNARQALTALSALPLDLERVHPMPAAGDGLDLEAAAEAYDNELGDTALDICLLGLGPDGHVASIFPEHPSSYADGRVVAVRASPKPPPERISLTLEVINTAA